jgi:hypothetical protein
MATVTSFTSDRMLAIEQASVISGTIDASGNLILTTKGGSQINAGKTTGPQGPAGPSGQDLAVVSAQPVLDVGVVNQIRAGRQLTAPDFTNMGLSPPLGLWNLSDLSDASGNGRALSNKGAVLFDYGINGLTSTAAQFFGNPAQCLYISDTGPNDPFRIRTGSMGCWFKTAKFGVAEQTLIGRNFAGGAQVDYYLKVTNSNVCQFQGSFDGSTWGVVLAGTSNIIDDRWHFAVVTLDGTVARLYVDGIMESIVSAPGLLTNTITCPLNLGSYGGDGGNSSGTAFTGRIDEAFVTSDVLSDDQVRNLYCAKIPHVLAAVPTRLSLNVRRRRRGGTLAAGDFSTQPLRLHNFTASYVNGPLADEGSGNVALTNNGAALAVSGVDGSAGNAFNFNGTTQSLSSTDTGLPSGVAARSYGCWLKTTMQTAGVVFTWGTAGTGDARLNIGYPAAGAVAAMSAADVVQGPYVADGQWHFVVVVEDNASLDGVKRKLYVDGRLTGVSTGLTAIVLAGANKLRVASDGTGSALISASIDGVFVCGYAMTSREMLALYAKGSQALLPSPKNVGDHVEAMDANNVFAIFDALDSQHQVDLRVAP